jgi:hypothetical protein
MDKLANWACKELGHWAESNGRVMERAEQLAVSVWAYFLFVLNVVGLFFIFSYIYIEYIIYTTFSCKNNGY